MTAMSPVVFPPLQSGGPIEAPRFAIAACRPAACFRRCKAAAPLKRPRQFLSDRPVHRFPPLQSGGPIEAGFTTISCPPIEMFPPLQSGGPIEAEREGGSRLRFLPFPPLQSGGPIEADSWLSAFGFRMFPSLKSGGPVEAGHRRLEADAT